MDILRKILVGIACGLLPLVLFSFGLSFSLHRVFGTPDALKGALSESGVYNATAENFLAMAQSNSNGINDPDTSQELSALPSDDPGVKSAAEKAFPGNSIQPQIEKLLDNIYAWIGGDSQKLDISVDLTPNKEDLLANLENYAKARAATLPACSAAASAPTDFDPFKATCLPIGVTPDMAAIATREKLLGSNFFQEKAFKVNAGKQSNDKSVTLGSYRVQDAQSAYQSIVKGIYMMGIVAVVCILMAIFLSRPLRIGIKRASKIALSVGVMTVVLALLSVFATERVANALARSASETPSFQASVVNAVNLLASEVRTWWLGYGILLIVLSIGAFLLLKALSEKDIIERNNITPPESRSRVVIN